MDAGVNRSGRKRFIVERPPCSFVAKVELFVHRVLLWEEATYKFRLEAQWLNLVKDKRL
jgi:hypothetical protein